MTKKCPCRHCEERKLGCHSTCKKYIEWKNLKEDENKIIAENRWKESFKYCRIPRYERPVAEQQRGLRASLNINKK